MNPRRWVSRSGWCSFNCRVFLLTLVLLAPGRCAAALAESAYDLIAQVNGLRSSLGLPAYQVDGWLMSYAQQHANYIASQDSGTHMRPDGSFPWDIGVQENVASGDGVSVYDAVYHIWVDEGHYKTMAGYPGGTIGAGIAAAADGTIYYVIDVRPQGVASKTITPAPATPAAFVPLTTNTPGPDGAIIHIVQPGETLWKIAVSYGVTVAEIRALNGLPADSTVIRAGQRLLIRRAGAAPAVEKEVASTPPATTDTSPSPSAPTVAATARQPSPTPTPSPATPPTAAAGAAAGTGGGDLLTFLIPGLLAIGSAAVTLYWLSRRRRS